MERAVAMDDSMASLPAVPDMRLELVPIPVSDVDRAKAFYERVGFANEHDIQVSDADAGRCNSRRRGQAAPLSSGRV